MRRSSLLVFVVLNGCLCTRMCGSASQEIANKAVIGMANHELAKQGAHIDTDKVQQNMQAMGQGNALNPFAAMAQAQQDWKPRPVVDFHKLEEVLPSSLDGWTAEPPEGRSVAAGPMSVSEAVRKFSKGPSHITVTIADWASNPAAAGLAFAFAVTEETGTGYKKPLTMSNGQGQEQWNSSNKHSEITGLTKNRFWVQISGDQLDSPQVTKDVFAKVDLAKLDGLQP